MREILFHGKRKDNGEWVEGFLIIRKIWSQTIYVIREQDNGFDAYVEYEVVPETVGQFTGLTDKNGKKIFEGNVVNVSVYYDVGCYPHSETEKRLVKIPDIYSSKYYHYEVIGDIHDNPEMIKDGESNAYNT